MRKLAWLALLAAIIAALSASIWMASRGTAPDRRDLEALVTVGGDIARDVTRPSLELTRLSDQEEMALGEAIDAEIRTSMSLSSDAATEAYLREILIALAAGVHRRTISYNVRLVASPDANAFAVAGGRIYVTEKMVSFAGSEAELAAILGHEIAHVDLRHCVERLQYEQAARAVSPGAGRLARLGYEIMQRGFSEQQELAADAAGAIMSAGASYDPWAAAELMGRISLGDRGPRIPGRNPVAEVLDVFPEMLRTYAATHPPSDQRIEAIRRALMARPETWRSQRRYAGRVNLQKKRSMQADPIDAEWIVRAGAPL